MPAITLYQFPGMGGLSLSPYCNKVHWALRLKGLVYRTEDLVFPGRVSETGQLPVLVYDAEKLHDSTLILRALEAHHPLPSLVPHDPRLAAQAYVLEEWADEGLSPLMVHYRWRDRASLPTLASHIMPAAAPWLGRLAMNIPRMRKRKHTRAIRSLGDAWARAALERHFDAIDALLAGGREWLLGDAPSIADIGVAAQLHTLTLGITPEPLAWLGARANASAWFERFLARASVRAA